MPRITFIRISREGVFHQLGAGYIAQIGERVSTRCYREGYIREVAVDEWTPGGKRVSDGPPKDRRCRACTR